MNNTIHLFDLDGTLWAIKNSAWVIKKDKPSKPILKLKSGEISSILSGVYINDEIDINYNGKKYWISEELFEKIKKMRPNIKKEDLGISFYEFIDPKYYDSLKFYKENIRHLIGIDNVDIGILSARFSNEKDKMLLVALKDELENVGINIDKFYYVGDHFLPNVNMNINVRKANILLEHLVGFHIEKDRFVPIKQDLYKEVHFYDDEPHNIFVANDIQDMLDGYLENTEDEVHNRIINNITTNKPILYNNLITNNKLNRFKTTKVELTEPVKFPIVKEMKIVNFNTFINEKKK